VSDMEHYEGGCRLALKGVGSGFVSQQQCGGVQEGLVLGWLNSSVSHFSIEK